MTFETIYWTNRSDDAYPTELSVSSEHGASLRVEASPEGSSPQVIGLFRSHPSAGELARLWQVVSAPAFQSERNAADVLPGEVVRRITVRIPGHPDVERIAAEASTDLREFEGAERLLVQLAERIREQPERATAISLSAPRVALDRAAGTVEMTFDVRNAGNTPAAIPAPAAWAAQSVTVTIFLLRTDLPVAQLRNEHQRILEIAPEDAAVSQPPGGGGRRDLLYLSPKSSIALRLTHRIGESPQGSCDAWAEIALPLYEADGSLVLHGLLRSARVPLSGLGKP